MTSSWKAPHFPETPPWRFDAESRPVRRQDAGLAFATRALHAGFRPLEDAPKFRSFVPPIVQTVTYPYESFEQFPDFIYSRSRNPTVAVLEDRLAALEGGEAAVSAGSGSQALFNLLFTLVRPGDNVVTCLHTFGEGYRQAATIFPKRCGVEFRFVSAPEDVGSWAMAIDSRTRLVWLETPSNPCLFVGDIAALADVAHAHGIPLLVDNTTATAALQRPLDLGADIILLSLTKFICGNAAVLGGAVVGPRGLVEDIRLNTTEYVGAIMAPFEAWLTLQFLETLEMRMARHSATAQKVAEFLADHPRVMKVNYPGLEDHPGHTVAKRQMTAYSGLLSFAVPGGMAAAARVLNAFQLITHAVTFGTSRTICMHPPTITHNEMSVEERSLAGIDDSLMRLSVGLEDPADILADLEQALARA